jgi:hypothetical protein
MVILVCIIYRDSRSLGSIEISKLSQPQSR